MSNVKVQGNASGTGSLTIAAPNTNTDRTLTLPDESGTLLSDSGAISVSASAPDNSIVINASGRLLVGTTTAADSNAMLTVYNPSATSAQICLQNTTTGTGSNGSRILATGNDLYITNKEAGFMAFETNDTERARIDSSGNLLVGGTTSTYGSKLVLYSSGGSNIIESKHAGTGAQYHSIFMNLNGAVGSIQTSGSTTSYVTSSDYRLKNTIAPMTGALAKVAALKPCTYKWNADGSDGEGFIAHELAEVCPHAVTGEKDAVDAEGKPVYQGIDTSFLVATLTAAIQEQQTIINAQQAALDSLTTRIAALEAK